MKLWPSPKIHGYTFISQKRTLDQCLPYSSMQTLAEEDRNSQGIAWIYATLLDTDSSASGHGA